MFKLVLFFLLFILASIVSASFCDQELSSRIAQACGNSGVDHRKCNPHPQCCSTVDGLNWCTVDYLRDNCCYTGN